MPTRIHADKTEGLRKLVETVRTPFLVIDEAQVRHKYRQFETSMPGIQILYALKTNPSIHIADILRDLGAGFEVSSEEELDILLNRGVASNRIISSNPIKSPAFIKMAHSLGIDYFAYDSSDEIEKLCEYAPGSKVYVRLAVSNEGSQWPLDKKFGVETEQAIELLAQAASTGNIIPWGITFHVGSQCIDERFWAMAIDKSKRVWDGTAKKGVQLRMLDIGGGFPIEYTTAIPQIEQIAEVIREKLKDTFPDEVEYIIEPGRALVGEAGTLVSTVIAKAKRNGNDWLYLDVGVFNGLMESISGITYKMTAEKEGALRRWVVAGPSCDSFDVVSNEVYLPDLEIGDKVYISSAGAYTTAYASRFNGLPIPEIHFI